VKYDGEWELWHYSSSLSDGVNYLDSGYSNAIHQGPGVANRLLIIVAHQSAYIYVNDTFIEQYQPQSYHYIDLSQKGAVGMFMSSAAMTGDFTDFSVSPAPPTDFWDVVPALIPRN
jgi:hypothetical protein